MSRILYTRYVRAETAAGRRERRPEAQPRGDAAVQHVEFSSVEKRRKKSPFLQLQPLVYQILNRLEHFYNVCARTAIWAARLVAADHAALESGVSSLMLGVIQRVVEAFLR